MKLATLLFIGLVTSAIASSSPNKKTFGFVLTTTWSPGISDTMGYDMIPAFGTKNYPSTWDTIEKLLPGSGLGLPWTSGFETLRNDSDLQPVTNPFSYAYRQDYTFRSGSGTQHILNTSDSKEYERDQTIWWYIISVSD